MADSEVTSETTPQVPWEELCAGHTVVIDGGCSKVVRPDGCRGEPGDELVGEIVQGAATIAEGFIVNQSKRKERSISVRGACVPKGSARIKVAWVHHQFVRSVGPAVAAGAGTGGAPRCSSTRDVT